MATSMSNWGRFSLLCLIALAVLLGLGVLPKSRADDAKATKDAAKGASAPAPSFARNYRVFYIVTDGAGNTTINPNVQIYLPQMLAQTINKNWTSAPPPTPTPTPTAIPQNGTIHPKPKVEPVSLNVRAHLTATPSPSSTPLPTPGIHYVAALGWGAADLASACSDPMVAGGLLITYTSWTTDNFWVGYNAEKFYITAKALLVSCANQTPTIVDEQPLSADNNAANIEPFHSRGRLTVPIAPLAVLSSLFGPKNQEGLTAVPSTFYHTTAGYYILITAFSKTTGNIGGINVEREAREVSDQITAAELSMIPETCKPTGPARTDEDMLFQTLVGVRTNAPTIGRPGANPVPKSSKAAAKLALVPGSSKKATPSPQPPKVAGTPTPMPPLKTLCEALGNPELKPTPAPTATPMPQSANGYP